MPYNFLFYHSSAATALFASETEQGQNSIESRFQAAAEADQEEKGDTQENPYHYSRNCTTR
jgi:hypothetical protein